MHPRCGMYPRPVSEFSEICNNKIVFVVKYEVVLQISTVISYDLVILTLPTANYKKTYFKILSANISVKTQG